MHALPINSSHKCSIKSCLCSFEIFLSVFSSKIACKMFRSQNDESCATVLTYFSVLSCAKFVESKFNVYRKQPKKLNLMRIKHPRNQKHTSNKSQRDDEWNMIQILKRRRTCLCSMFLFYRRLKSLVPKQDCAFAHERLGKLSEW